MSREIRFRAWDKKEKAMASVENLNFEFNMANLHFSHDYFKDNIDLNEVELMQFTGLQDRSGREIFEGDILQSIDGGVIKEVRFNTFHAMFETVILKSVEEYWIGSVSMLSKYICDNYHVIGNIYENQRSGATKSQVSCEGEAVAEQNSELLK